jgi:hypothetical protein
LESSAGRWLTLQQGFCRNELSGVSRGVGKTRMPAACVASPGGGAHCWSSVRAANLKGLSDGHARKPKFIDALHRQYRGTFLDGHDVRRILRIGNAEFNELTEARADFPKPDVHGRYSASEISDWVSNECSGKPAPASPQDQKAALLAKLALLLA